MFLFVIFLNQLSNNSLLCVLINDVNDDLSFSFALNYDVIFPYYEFNYKLIW